MIVFKNNNNFLIGENMNKMFLNGIVIIILAAINLSAQPHGRMMKDDGLRSKLQEYHKVNVCPMWTEWRSKLESSMSKEDIDRLNALRSEVQKVIAEKKECLEECRKNSDGTARRRDGEGRNKSKRNAQGKCNDKCGLWEARAKYGAELKEILNKYDNTVKSIMNESEPYHEKWQSEKQQIIKEHFANIDENKYKRRSKHMRNNKLKGYQDRDRSFMGMLLMWNGSCESNPEDLLDLGTNSANRKTGLAIEVFPNPFVESTSINFTLVKSSKVKLSVNSSTGEQVAVLFDGDLDAGDHSYLFKAGSLTPGAYIYNLNVDGKVITGKMILNK